MGWLSDKKAAVIKINEENLYAFSSPLPDEGIGGELKTMLQKAGITHPPEIRSSESLGYGGMALTGKDAVLVNTGTPKPVLKALSAHEVAHVVFRETGELEKKQEHRADRFAVVVSGEGKALAEYLRVQDKAFQEELQMFRDLGMLGKIGAGFRSHKNNKMYGSIEERVANIELPITDAERQEFSRAIEAYNARKTGQAQDIPVVTVTTQSPSQLPKQAVQNIAAVSDALSRQNGGKMGMEAVDGITVPKGPELSQKRQIT